MVHTQKPISWVKGIPGVCKFQVRHKASFQKVTWRHLPDLDLWSPYTYVHTHQANKILGEIALCKFPSGKGKYSRAHPVCSIQPAAASPLGLAVLVSFTAKSAAQRLSLCSQRPLSPSCRAKDSISPSFWLHQSSLSPVVKMRAPRWAVPCSLYLLLCWKKQLHFYQIHSKERKPLGNTEPLGIISTWQKVLLHANYIT